MTSDESDARYIRNERYRAGKCVDCGERPHTVGIRCEECFRRYQRNLGI